MISTCSQTTHPTAEVALPNPRRTVWTTKTTRSSEFSASPLLSFGLCFSSSVLCCENCLAHTRKARQASHCSNNNSNTSTTTQGREPSQAYCSLSAIQFFSSISLVFLPAAQWPRPRLATSFLLFLFLLGPFTLFFFHFDPWNKYSRRQK